MIEISKLIHFSSFLACQSPLGIEASIPFEVWSRSYSPMIQNKLIARVRI